MINICQICSIEFESVKEAKTCSPKCRKDLSRIGSVTPNVTLSDPIVTLDFEFYTVTKGREPLKGQEKESDQRSVTRRAKYWYDVPLAAIPIIKKDWPQVPEGINGRQYFLWWQNEFKTEKDGQP